MRNEQFNTNQKELTKNIALAFQKRTSKQAGHNPKKVLRGMVTSEITFKTIELEDALDQQINLSCDHLVNKILYYLSKLPAQYSIQKMQPKMAKLCEYARFYDYLASLPRATDQMAATRVMYTDLPAGKQ